MIHLLLVEDDETLGQALSQKLSKEGYEVEWKKTFKETQQAILAKLYDLVIFDVGLPDGTGFDGASELKKTTNTPFIFVTAQSDAQTRLDAFELGAEEFIPKPFHLKELLLRVSHVLENHRPTTCKKFDGFQVDLNAMLITFNDGKEIQLATRDFKILKLLIEKSPAVVSRDEILNSVWGSEDFPTNRTIDNSIVRIRQSLNPYSEHLVSVRGVGYQWKN